MELVILCLYFFKRKNVPHIIGYLIMIIFFIIGRFFAIDLNETRLNEKILNLFILDSYNVSLERFNAVVMSSSSEIKAISLGLIFILLEYFSIRIYGLNRPYHLFRKPVATIIITLFVITFAVNNSELLYARLKKYYFFVWVYLFFVGLTNFANINYLYALDKSKKNSLKNLDKFILENKNNEKNNSFWGISCIIWSIS